MVKKVDSQKTKDDSNECDQKAAEIRRNAQKLKAEKRKKVRFLSLTIISRTDKIDSSHARSSSDSSRKLLEPNFNWVKLQSSNLFKPYLKNKLSLSTKMFKWKIFSPTLVTTWNLNRYSNDLTRMRLVLRSRKISR